MLNEIAVESQVRSLLSCVWWPIRLTNTAVDVGYHLSHAYHDRLIPGNFLKVKYSSQHWSSDLALSMARIAATQRHVSATSLSLSSASQGDALQLSSGAVGLSSVGELFLSSRSAGQTTRHISSLDTHTRMLQISMDRWQKRLSQSYLTHSFSVTC
jgi:hypothetical protein